MTANIVNLRQARKAKARKEKEQVAAENRARYGLSKAEKLKRLREEALASRRLDGHQHGQSMAGPASERDGLEE